MMANRTRGVAVAMLQDQQYCSDGDTKSYATLKDMYGTNSVQKLECIGHVQKHVG